MNDYANIYFDNNIHFIQIIIPRCGPWLEQCETMVNNLQYIFNFQVCINNY